MTINSWRRFIVITVVCLILSIPVIMLVFPNETIHLQLPLRHYTLPFDTLTHKQWYTDLLGMPTTSDVILLSCDYAFMSMLFNWLAAFRTNTESDLSEVIILAMDEQTHNILTKKHLHSIYITNEDIFIPNVQLVTEFSHIWIKRSTVTRILNHHGYNVIMFDLDAIVLKDVIKLMKSIKDVDIIGSMGKYPFTLGREWGFTLCMGVAVFRSGSGTELFWNAVSALPGKKKQDDQVRTNEALKQLNITWCQCSAQEQRSTCAYTSKSPNGVKVILISRKLICRSCSKVNMRSYYVWHNHSSRNGTVKEAQAKRNHLWYLRSDWRSILSKYNGKELIERLTETRHKHH